MAVAAGVNSRSRFPHFHEIGPAITTGRGAGNAALTSAAARGQHIDIAPGRGKCKGKRAADCWAACARVRLPAAPQILARVTARRWFLSSTQPRAMGCRARTSALSRSYFAAAAPMWLRELIFFHRLGFLNYFSHVVLRRRGYRCVRGQCSWRLLDWFGCYSSGDILRVWTMNTMMAIWFSLLTRDVGINSECERIWCGLWDISCPTGNEYAMQMNEEMRPMVNRVISALFADKHFADISDVLAWKNPLLESDESVINTNQSVFLVVAIHFNCTSCSERTNVIPASHWRPVVIGQ